MSKNLTVVDEIKKVIKDSARNVVDETAKRVLEELKSNRLVKTELSYYRRVELLLYNYENLKEAVKQKEEDLEYIEEHGLPESSKSIVIYSSAGGTSKEDRYLQLKEKYIREKIETERDIKRIDNALNKIRNDKYFSIIQYKYLNAEEEKIGTDEQLAEKINKDRKTIVRNRKRLINKLVTIFFPESLKDVM